MALFLQNPGSEAQSRLREFRRLNRLPQWVSMGSFDQQLVFNLGDRQDAAFFMECIQGLKEVTLREYILPDREIRAGEQPLAGQLVGFLHHERPVYIPLPASAMRQRKQVRRSFPPGSNWLYLKIYCTPLTAGIILEKVVRPVLRQYSARIAGWFFIRYTDPGYHLRLRINIKGTDGGAVLGALCSRLESTGTDRLVHALLGDTYQRELERYGVAYMELAEEVFHCGSELALDNDDALEFEQGLSVALNMLRSFFDGAEAAGLAHDLSESFLAEFRADKKMRLNLDGKFRALRPFPDVGSEKAATGKNMARLMTAMRAISLAAKKETIVKRRQLLADLVHMQLNRTFRSDQRKQELVVWYCPSKYLRSLKIRADKASY